MANEPKWPSFEWRDQVRNDPQVTHFQWRVADALAERVDRRTGYAQFYQREIVDELGCSMRGAHGALHQLVKRLHLEIQNLGRADGKLRYIPVVKATLVGATHRRAYPYASACAPDTHGDSDGVCTAVRTKESPRETPEKPPQEPMSITRAFEEEFWPFYPRRVSKGTARKVYERVLKSKGATAEELKLGAMRYAMERAGQDPNFTKYPATWLNAESWKDESSPPIAQDGSLGMTRAGGNGYAAMARWSQK